MATTISPDAQHALGRRLKYLRESAGMTRELVGVRIGRSVSVISGWEAGRRAPRLPLLAQLAQLYGVPLWELIPEETADAAAVG